MKECNWRDGQCKRRARVFDLETGDEIPFVFYCVDDTSARFQLGRFQTLNSSAGKVIEIHPLTKKPIEIWEFRKIRVEWLDPDTEEQIEKPLVARHSQCP